METPEPAEIPQLLPTPSDPENATALEFHEVRLLARIEGMLQPLQIGLNNLNEEWSEHKEEMKRLKMENFKLDYKLTQEQKKTRELSRCIRWLEDETLEKNVIIHGIVESNWETKDQCKEKLFGVLANLINRNTWQEKIDSARQIPIITVRKIGQYNSMRCCPIAVTFENRMDVEYLLENKKRLGHGIFADQEYGPETEKNRKLLRPIFNLARKYDNYKGMCKIEGDKVILRGKEYIVETIGTLPEEVNGFRVSSKTDGSIFAFFGELNPLSNFHPCEFEHNGIIFHS